MTGFEDPGATRWPAPAKINLFLHITGRRADGYHFLRTVFQFLDFCDYLEFAGRSDGNVQRLDGVADIDPAQDLTVRAALLLQRVTGTRFGVDIRLDKRIPIGGGLGGGSSDAATTLVALNRLWRLGLTDTELMELGLQLGADVPVFILGRAAWAEGVGERLEPLELPEPYYLVIAPPCHVATASVFAAPELTRNCPPITIHDFLSGHGGNVLEPVVRRRYPEVAAALDWLAGFAPSRMSGSGACVFAAFENSRVAEATLNRLPSGWRGFVARGRNRSPLRERADREGN